MISKIVSLISPPQFPIYTGDIQQHKQVSQKLGIELPYDYFKLIDNYGSGVFCDCIRVYTPYTENKDTNLFNAIRLERTLYNNCKSFFYSDKDNDHPKIKEYFKKQIQLSGASGVGYPFDFYPQKNGIVPWGTWDSTYMFYWNTSVKPWSIVVYGDDELYFEYNTCISDFLFKLFTGEIVIEGNYLQQKSFYPCP